MEYTERAIFFTLALAFYASAARAQSFCVTCLKLRVGRPLISLGPTDTPLDNRLNEIKLATGQYRGFSGNKTTYRMDSADSWSIGGMVIPVLGPGSSFPDKCGRWINDTFKVGSTVHGFIHNEFANNCREEKHHRSMSYATSGDEGSSWTGQGLIIDYGSH